MTITALVLNYNNYLDLKNCLMSLRRQILPDNYELKIVIIDNHSLDGSTARIQAEFPDYAYIYNTANLGFAAGVNQGIKKFWDESDFFLLANNDATLAPDCLKNLLAAAELNSAVVNEPSELSESSEPNGGLYGPAIFYQSAPEKIWQGGGYFSRARMNVRVPDKNKPLLNRERRAVDFVSGCIMLIDKKVLAAIGLLDENFFFYGEDLDLGLRAKTAGFKIIYEPRAAAWHNISEIAISRTSPWVLKNLAKSYFLIIRKHFPRRRLYGLALFIFIYTPWRLGQIIRGHNNLKNILAWFKGAYDGLSAKLTKT